MTTLIFLPVLAVIDVERSTSRVFFRPSGVSSKAQAKSTANGKPIATRSTSVLKIQSGAPNPGSRVSAICTTSQPTIT